MDRLNPVTLITGAASGVGVTCLRELARRSQGGLILVDLDDASLCAVADDLEKQNLAPERVSTLAFDVADEERWTQASDFIEAQYGRLDWAVIYAGMPKAPKSDLLDFRRPSSLLDSAARSVRALMPVMRKNLQGGAVVINAAAEMLKEPGGAAAKSGVLPLLRVLAKEGAPDRIRVNAVAPGATTNAWAKTPWFNDLVRETGGAREAFDKIAKMPALMARYANSDDIGRLIVMLLSDESPMTGATLVVDGGYTL
jgi:NAD(P)-dependent dehydrogenase (short-subunit alcohol dehydrogenase family)